MAERSAWDELRSVRRGRKLVRFIYLDSQTQEFIEPRPTDTHLCDGDTFIVPDHFHGDDERAVVIAEYDRRWYAPNGQQQAPSA